MHTFRGYGNSNSAGVCRARCLLRSSTATTARGQRRPEARTDRLRRGGHQSGARTTGGIGRHTRCVHADARCQKPRSDRSVRGRGRTGDEPRARRGASRDERSCRAARHRVERRRRARSCCRRSARARARCDASLGRRRDVRHPDRSDNLASSRLRCGSWNRVRPPSDFDPCRLRDGRARDVRSGVKRTDADTVHRSRSPRRDRFAGRRNGSPTLTVGRLAFPRCRARVRGPRRLAPAASAASREPSAHPRASSCMASDPFPSVRDSKHCGRVPARQDRPRRRRDLEHGLRLWTQHVPRGDRGNPNHSTRDCDGSRDEWEFLSAFPDCWRLARRRSCVELGRSVGRCGG